MKKLSLSLMFLLTLLCLCQDVSAQSKNGNGKDNFLKRTIHGIFNPKVRYDTSYIAQPWGKWTISPNENFTQHRYIQFVENATYNIRNEICMTTGLKVSYKGIGLGYSVNFRKINGKTTDKDMTINIYSNSFGIDFRRFDVGDFYDSKYNDHWPEKSCLKGLNINAYYVINNKKFSYPSAFSYSKIQKKNAGSVILGMSYYKDDLWDGKDVAYYKDLFADIPEDIEIHETMRCYLSDWRTEYISIGAGYAYNWVPTARWLIHVSAQLSPMIYQKMVVTYNDVTVDKPAGVPGSETTIKLENPEERIPYKFYNFVFNGRFSVTYSWKRGFVGVCYLGNMNYIDMPKLENTITEKTTLIYHWWNAKLSVGFRF